MSILKLIVVLLVSISVVQSLTCQGNCPSGVCSSCWCGQTKNIVDIASICSKYNWDQKCCQCIIGRQSGGNANAMSIDQKMQKTGLLQLRQDVRALTCRLQNKEALCQPLTNMDCAYKFYQLNRGFQRPWRQSAIACGCNRSSLRQDVI